MLLFALLACGEKAEDTAETTETTNEVTETEENTETQSDVDTFCQDEYALCGKIAS